MPGTKAYNSTVAARTRAATHILETPDLRTAYEDGHGLIADLEVIRDEGVKAEAANQLQSGAQAAGTGASLMVLQSYVQLQKDYSTIMGVVQAVLGDVAAETVPPADLVASLKKILVNEAELTVSIVKDGDKKKRTATRSASQEALRAEIEKDAAALVALTATHARLAARKVDLAKLEALKADAAALKGKLADRAAKKGAKKSATQEETAAVEAQRAKWGACYRLLAALGRKDQRVQALLDEAAR